MSDNKMLPPETFEMLAKMGYVPVYDDEDRVTFLERSHYAECVDKGIISGRSRQ